MKIAVLGTGMVGLALASRLAELGHDVTVGTRDVDATLARTESDQMGNPPYADWAHAHSRVALATVADASAHAELVINATSGNASITALAAAGREHLAGKVLLDIANPLDYSQGFPPSLFVGNTDSLAEQIQAAFPEAKVVKSLNTMNALLMANPRRLADGDHTVFVSGNDAQAKAAVGELLKSFGWKDILDLGDVSSARGPEMYMAMWLRLWGATKTGMVNVKVVR